MKKVDYIIVGQGIAGTILSFLMLEKNISHVVITDDDVPSASSVSAGMMNPLVFKRITKSWNIDTLLPFAKNVYTRLEKKLKNEYVTEIKIAKILTSEEEVNWWDQRVKNQGLEFYFDGFSGRNLIPRTAHAHKFAIIKKGAHVDIPALTNDYKNYLIQNQMLINEKIDFDKLLLFDKNVTYGKIKADKVIFCEGAHIVNNPYFNFIPFYLTKGDLLIVSSDEFKSSYVVSKDKFLLPIKKEFIFGSTYINTNNPLVEPDELEKKNLEKQLKKMIDTPFKTKKHLCGIRPTIKDRRPVLGLHPIHNQLAVFNGLGTKGTILAPYHASLLLDYLLGKIGEFEKEISIERFVKQKLN